MSDKPPFVPTDPRSLFPNSAKLADLKTICGFIDHLRAKGIVAGVPVPLNGGKWSDCDVAVVKPIDLVDELAGQYLQIDASALEKEGRQMERALAAQRNALRSTN